MVFGFTIIKTTKLKELKALNKKLSSENTFLIKYTDEIKYKVDNYESKIKSLESKIKKVVKITKAVKITNVNKKYIKEVLAEL